MNAIEILSVVLGCVSMVASCFALGGTLTMACKSRKILEERDELKRRLLDEISKNHQIGDVLYELTTKYYEASFDTNEGVARKADIQLYTISEVFQKCGQYQLFLDFVKGLEENHCD